MPNHRRDETELMDEPEQVQTELAANLRDIRRVNRMLGGTAVILRHLPRLSAVAAPEQPSPRPLRGHPAPNAGRGVVSFVPSPRIGRGWLRKEPGEGLRSVTILDLATGSADIPVAIARWARRHQLNASLIASDVSPEMLDLAKAQIAGYPEIVLARYDGRAVPLPDHAVDIVLCSLALHHFPPDEAVRVLTEMHRLARVGFIVNDLRRTWIGYAAAWLAAQLTTRNRLTRNDAPLSVLRAYTPAELARLLRQAGIADATITTHRWFRMAAIAIKDAPDA